MALGPRARSLHTYLRPGPSQGVTAPTLRVTVGKEPGARASRPRPPATALRTPHPQRRPPHRPVSAHACSHATGHPRQETGRQRKANTNCGFITSCKNHELEKIIRDGLRHSGRLALNLPRVLGEEGQSQREPPHPSRRYSMKTATAQGGPKPPNPRRVHLILLLPEELPAPLYCPSRMCSFLKYIHLKEELP